MLCRCVAVITLLNLMTVCPRSWLFINHFSRHKSLDMRVDTSKSTGWHLAFKLQCIAFATFCNCNRSLSFISFSRPSPLCWCHTTFLFIFCNSFKHYSPLGHAETDLDDCKSQLSWKTEFLLIGLTRQLAIISCYLITHSARSLGVICDEELIFSDQMWEISCYSHIC